MATITGTITGIKHGAFVALDMDYRPCYLEIKLEYIENLQLLKLVKVLVQVVDFDEF